MTNSRRVLFAACLPVCLWLAPAATRANTPVVVQNEAGFEGLEEPTVIYFPDTNTFENDPTNFQNHVDEGGGMFRDTLRNEYPTPQPPYASGPGWWDGDGANPANTDRQRSEPKGIVGLGHQQVEQTFEYSFDFRTDLTFQGTSNFCHIFQLKATNGDDSPPLATISLYKNGSGIQGRVDCFTDGTTGNNTEIIPTTFSYTAGQWIHFVIRITPCAEGETTGGIQLSVNGGAFTGITNSAIDLTGSTDFRPKFGFYRGMSTTNGVPIGDSWVEHRTISGYFGTSNILTWQGGQNNNTWDTAATANFLNGATSSVFNTIDQINFTGSTNTNINISGNVWPDFADVNSSSNYTFAGTGAISGGTLRKDGTGTLTLATTNSYDGLTDVRAGTLFVTGSIGNNSLVSLTGGTLKAGSTTALGSNSTIGTQINGGTLDINGFNLSTEPISAAGAGVSSAGAIINSGAAQTSALNNVTLTADTTFGGTGRWDIRGTGATLSSGGNAFNLTKTGTNQISFVGTNFDAAIGNIAINQGILAFQTSTTSMGDPTKALTIASGATLDFFNTTAAMNKIAALNGGTIWAESGTGSQNTFSGPVTLGTGGGILDAGDALTGGNPNSNAVLTLTGPISGSTSLTKNGPGLVTLSGISNYSGSTSVTAGTLALASTGSLTSPSLTVSSGATFNVNGALATNATLNANGTVNFGATTGATILARTLAALNIANTGTVTVTAPTSHAARTVLVSPITFTGSSGKLDLSGNDLVIPNGATTLSTIAGELKSGFNVHSGYWNGAGGILSSAAAGDTTHLTTLGYNTGGSPFDGVNTTSNDVLLKYTYYGDADLNGSVDGADYQQIDHGFGSHLTGWSNGDFNYDGVVNGSDYALIDNTFNQLAATGAAPLAIIAGQTNLIANAGTVSAAPEPAASAVLFGFAALMARQTTLTAFRR